MKRISILVLFVLAFYCSPIQSNGQVGAAALIVGWRTHWAALGLAIYCVLTAYFFHNFWAVPDAQVAGQTIHFLKNIAIAGGFLGLMAWGAGPLSLDARQAAAQEDLH